MIFIFHKIKIVCCTKTNIIYVHKFKLKLFIHCESKEWNISTSIKLDTGYSLILL